MQMAPNNEQAYSRRILSSAQNRISILVIEDDPDDFRAISRLLSQLKRYSVRTVRVSSGSSARTYLLTSCYDIVIVDYRLGLENGVDAIKAITRQRQDVASILVTGYLSPEVEEAALDAGAVRCIDKDALSTTMLESVIGTAFRTVFQQQHIHAAFQDYGDRAERPYQLQ